MPPDEWPKADFSNIWNAINDPWRGPMVWPDSPLAAQLRKYGKVCLAMYQRQSHAVEWGNWNMVPKQPIIEELVVKFHSYVFYKHGITVTFQMRGQESEPVFVAMHDLTSTGLLKAADDFLIGLDDEVV